MKVKALLVFVKRNVLLLVWSGSEVPNFVQNVILVWFRRLVSFITLLISNLLAYKTYWVYSSINWAAGCNAVSNTKVGFRFNDKEIGKVSQPKALIVYFMIFYIVDGVF